MSADNSKDFWPILDLIWNNEHQVRHDSPLVKALYGRMVEGVGLVARCEIDDGTTWDYNLQKVEATHWASKAKAQEFMEKMDPYETPEERAALDDLGIA